ncbi:MAG: ABC transporter ATP-binding protein [Candidatus Promineifilaceae bacterium]
MTAPAGGPDEAVIQTHKLTKRYGDFTAVDRLDLVVQPGEVYGLLGPNGSGKTTTILMLLGLTIPSRGTVRVLGFDPGRKPLSVKSRVGYLPDQVGFYDNLSAEENLIYIARLNGLERGEAGRRIAAVLAQMELGEVASNRVGTFSRGMRQRLGVAEVLLKRPQLIILDEPTLGLDPEAAREFLLVIGRLRAEGITILLSSHLLHQVQAVCDRVGLFQRGRKVLEGRVDELARQVLGSAYRIHLEADGPAELGARLEALAGIRAVSRQDGHFELEAAGDLRAEVAQAVVAAGGRLYGLAIESPNLEEIYARYFQRPERPAGAGPKEAGDDVSA